jgi:adenosylcobinamide kinase/adenosylcobinamide-phosphate guanylyltransferase
MTRSIIVVGGGVRSGKSSFALTRARSLGGRLGFVATAQALDAEMAARIAGHVRTRGPEFRTIEEPFAIPERLAALGDLDHTIIVTNEVGMRVVPESALGRAFRDIAGDAHQRLAVVADELYLAALGIIVRLRPDPIAVQRGGERP